ncbi:MAG: LUD domain-containing protein [Oscillospiraceae bacterium]|nr:LUD domain-containing protein [Oscillospiraceae bacterium]
MNIQNTISALERKGYTARFFETGAEAVAYLERAIEGKVIGFGGSWTLYALKLHEVLGRKNTVIDPDYPDDGREFEEVALDTVRTQHYMLSANAMSEDGVIVNLDGHCNRIAGSVFGHEKIWYVIGTNKIVPSLEDAIWRTRNVAAPKNARFLKRKTPCAVKGDRCYDCSSPDRICSGLLINLQKTGSAEVEVILINEELGY